MHPYYLAKLKRFTLPAIQEIVSADAYGDRKAAVDTLGSANVGNNRRWLVKYLWQLFAEATDTTRPTSMKGMKAVPAERQAQRDLITNLQKEYGDDWLLCIVLKCSGVEEADLSFFRSSFF